MERENRILTVMNLELSGKLLKLEDQLEKTINSDLNIDEKVIKMTDLLSQIVLTEKSLEKFKTMISTNNPDNN